MTGYKQYTACTSPSSWMSSPAYIAVATAALAAVLTVMGVASGLCGLFLLEVFAAAGGVAFCDWWLNVRLVCLGGDESLIGMVVTVEAPDDKSWPASMDSDYSMNMMVFPTTPGVDQAGLVASVPYGRLAAETDGVRDHVGFFRGEKATSNGVTTWVMHAEFEGAGIADFRIGLIVAYGLAFAAWAACVAIPPPFGIIVAAILALLAFLAALFGSLFGAGDTASPSDVDGAPTEILQPDPTTGLGADLLYVHGRWVFDSLHEGWNELHPIKVCTKVGSWNGAWPGDIVDVQKRLDDAFTVAERADVVGRQQKPEHQWKIHPLIDGCLSSGLHASDPTPDLH